MKNISSQKKWKTHNPISDNILSSFREINPITLQLLHNRGITETRGIENFLNPDYSQDLHDPFLFKDMKLVVERLLTAVKNSERVLIHGDYDADGVCSSLMLFEVLVSIGLNEPDIYLPHRDTQGYGLNMATVDHIKKNAYSMVITADCGTSNIEELKALREAGIDVIIFDHHVSAKEKPPCFAMINPKFKKDSYPFAHLSSGGVIFKVIQALGVCQSQEKWSLDLACIATVADMMPLVDENRIIVKYGLIVLNKTKRLGLKALVEKAGKKLGSLNTIDIGFCIAPRINSAGRISHANAGVFLLKQTDAKKAEELAEDLNKTNSKRQAMTERIITQAISQITAKESLDLVLVANDTPENPWPTGIVGLAAGKIAQKYHRPAFAIGRSKTSITGSGRSIPGFNITLALQECEDLFSKFGGHPQACGFTLKSESLIPEFKKRINEIAKAKLKDADLIPSLDIDMQIGFSSLDWALFEEIEKIQPFGQGNPKPCFAAKQVEVQSFQAIGNGEKHLRLTLKHEGVIRKAIAFGFGSSASLLKIGDLVDIAFEFEVNEWNGNRELQLNILDVKI